MAELRKIVNIFIASPGDMGDERKMAFEVVEKVRKMFKTTGISIELNGWEDTMPGCGRPQSLINPEVDICDLFIGVLGTRWGSATGKYSSGFEEEYERAHDRYKVSGSPQMWLFFKHISSDLLSDPGEQLKEVIRFRKKLEASREFLYKEFSNLGEWHEILQLNLSRFIVEQFMINVKSTPMSPPLPNIIEDMRRESIVDLQTEVNISKAQLCKTMNFFNHTIDNNKIEMDNTNALYHMARLKLYATALMSQHYSGDLVDTHTVNVLYKRKEEISLSDREKTLIIRSLISDQYVSNPGWYWVEDLNEADFRHYLIALTLHDNNNDVRTAALKMMSEINVTYKDEGFTKNIISLLLKEDSNSIKTATLEYIVNTFTQEDIPLIKLIFQEVPDEIGQRLQEIVFCFEVKTSPNEKFLELLSGQTGCTLNSLKTFNECGSILSVQLLTQAVKHSELKIREFAVDELVRRKCLPKETAILLLIDKSNNAWMKANAYKVLIEKGEVKNSVAIRKTFEQIKRPGLLFINNQNEPDVDSIIELLINTWEFDDIVKQIEWLNVDGYIAYKVAGIKYYEKMGNRVRDDLDYGFKSIKSDLIQSFIKAGIDNDSFINPDLEEFILTRFQGVALEILAVHGKKDDVKYARRLIKSKVIKLQMEAVRLIHKWGDYTDLPQLLDIALNTYDTVLREMATISALKHSPGLNGVAPELMKSSQKLILQLCLQSLDGESELKILDFLRPYLYDENADKRLLVLAYLVRKLQREELVNLLSNYIKNVRYFYNVTGWLDRILYSNTVLRKMYTRNLATLLVVKRVDF